MNWPVRLVQRLQREARGEVWAHSLFWFGLFLEHPALCLYLALNEELKLRSLSKVKCIQVQQIIVHHLPFKIRQQVPLGRLE